MKKVINTATRTITFSFDKESGLSPVEFDPARVSEANRAYAILHGFAARIGDNAAIQKSKENNYTVTEQMRRDAVLELVNFYHNADNKDWSPRATSSGKAPAVNPTWKLIAEARGMTYEQYCAWKTEQDLAELAQWTAAKTGARNGAGMPTAGA